MGAFGAPELPSVVGEERLDRQSVPGIDAATWACRNHRRKGSLLHEKHAAHYTLNCRGPTLADVTRLEGREDNHL